MASHDTAIQNVAHPKQTKRTTTLVFLAEQDVQPTKLIQRAGFVHLRGDDPEWFEDQRYLPQQQAQYLRKLSRMRQDLIHQQHTSAQTEAHSPPNRSTGSLSARYEPRSQRPVKNAFAERHKKLHATKQEALFSRNRKSTPPKFNATGQQLIEPKSSTLSHSMENISSNDTNSMVDSEPSPLKLPYLSSPSLGYLSARMDTSYDTVNEIIDVQRSRLKEIQNSPLHKPSIPQSSHKLGGRQGIDRSNSSHESFIRKIPMSKKTKKGICRGKPNVNMNHFLRGDTDKMHFPTEFFDATMFDSQAIVPPSSPRDGAHRIGHNDRRYIRTLEEQRKYHEKYHKSSDYKGKQASNVKLTKERNACIFCDKDNSSSSSSSKVFDTENTERSRVALDESSDTPSSRRHIVVDIPGTYVQENSIPEVVLRSPSPSKAPVPRDGSTASLIKTVRQNELREKEVKNLLEDVRELNQLNRSLNIEEWAESC